VKLKRVKLNRKITAGLSAAAAAAIFFAWLAHAVTAGTLAWFDLTVRNTIHSWASPVLTRAMRGITQLGSPTFLIVLGFLAAWRMGVRKRMRAAGRQGRSLERVSRAGDWRAVARFRVYGSTWIYWMSPRGLPCLISA